MKKVVAFSLVSILVLLFSYGIISAWIWFFDPFNKDYKASLKYCPENYPNSRWICKENNSFFVVDSEGRVNGATAGDNTEFRFHLLFRRDIKRSDFNNVNVYAEISVSPYPKYLFNCRAVFYEGKCEIHFIGEDDEEHVFGNHKGETVLVFVMEQENDFEQN